MNVLNGFEPCQSRVMDMMRFIVQHHEFVNFPGQCPPRSTFESVVAPVGRLPEEVVHRVFIIGGRRGLVARIDPMDIGQKDVAGGAGDAHFVLSMQGQLEIVTPVVTVKTVVGQHDASCDRQNRCRATRGRQRKRVALENRDRYGQAQ